MQQTLGSSSKDVLPSPVSSPGRSLTTLERQALDRSATIKGWGSDLDAGRRPGVPRDKAPQLGVELLYPPIPQQTAPFTIHKSTEHARLTPVFGTSCPPSGLSGKIRDFAYKYSEGRLMRWMGLMVADRVNVAEGLISDLAHGRVPNIPREMGIRSELQYNRAGFYRKVGVALGCTAVLLGAWHVMRRR